MRLNCQTADNLRASDVKGFSIARRGLIAEYRAKQAGTLSPCLTRLKRSVNNFDDDLDVNGDRIDLPDVQLFRGNQGVG